MPDDTHAALASVLLLLMLAVMAWASEWVEPPPPATLTATVGAAFFLPVPLDRDPSRRLESAQFVAHIIPAGALAVDHATAPAGCLVVAGPPDDTGMVTVALACDGRRTIGGPVASLVLVPKQPGTAIVRWLRCRVGEAVVGCPTPVGVEIVP